MCTLNPYNFKKKLGTCGKLLIMDNKASTIYNFFLNIFFATNKSFFKILISLEIL